MSLILETQRLRLVPIAADRLNTLHHILIDPYVRKYLCDDTIFSLQQTQDMLSESQRLFAEQKLGLWAIELRAEPETMPEAKREAIGFIGLWYFFGEDQPQLVYALLPEATGKGYATEAATRILEYSFNELGYSYMIASTDLANLLSQRVAERLGMQKVEERLVDDCMIVFFRLER